MKPNSAVAHAGIFAGLCVLGLAVLHQPLGLLASSALTNDDHSSILLVLPISVALLWSERATIFSKLRYSRAALFPLCLLLVALVIFRTPRGLPDQESWLSISMLLFAGWIIASFIFSYGLEAFAGARFPLLLLFLMAPLPEGLHQRLVTWLQYGSADATSWLFQIANIPFTRNGVVLTLPRLSIEIAQECSGIRSSMVLLIVTLLLGHLYLKSAWSRTALMVLLVPVTIGKNGLRIFVLAMLGMYVDPSFLTGWLHHGGGIVFFALAFGCMWGFAVLFHKLEKRGSGGSAISGRSAPVIAANHPL